MSNFNPLRSLRRTLCVAIFVSAQSLSVAAIFQNGAVNDVNYAAGTSTVRNSASGQSTTVNALAGATFFNGLGVEDTSIANFYTGSAAGFVSARDQSAVNIFGGSFEYVDGTDSSAVLIQNGAFTRSNNTVRIFHDSTATIAGGTFSVLNGNMVVVQDNGSLTILGGMFTGGRIYAGEVGGKATVNISGGLFTKPSGQGLAQIFNVYDTVTTIYGQNFNLPFGMIAQSFNGILSGVLANGDVIEVNLINSVSGSNTGRIILVHSPISEPETAILFAIGVATVSATLRRRSRMKPFARTLSAA